MEMNNSAMLLPAAFQQDFNPWAVPDSFTVYKFAPEYVRPLLHPHWQTQKAVHPFWAYFFGLYYFVMGIISFYSYNYSHFKRKN